MNEEFNLKKKKLASMFEKHINNLYYYSEVFNKEQLCYSMWCLKKANELALPLEINMYGLRENRAYPRADFWTLAGALGATAILGCDCHRIEHVADQDEIKQAQEYAARFGLNIVDKIDLRSPF